MVTELCSYPFSSYPAFIGQVKALKWLELNWLLTLFGPSRRSAAINYGDFVEKVDIAHLENPAKDISGGFILGGVEFVDWVKESFLSNRRGKKDIPQLRPLKPRNTPIVIVEAACPEFNCLTYALFTNIICAKNGCISNVEGIMQRVAEQHLKKWIENEQRKPLVIRGARQVGKSTLVRRFADENKLILNEINLEQHLELNNIFKTLDTKLISKELEGLLGRKIISPGSILFLDEIQATPNALQALRYFYEDLPELPVVAAGSLLEFVLSKHTFPMPVGRIEYVHLGPMTFEEYLSEIDGSLLKYIIEFDFSDDIPKTVQKKLLDRQREYLLVGGMPEAILNYLRSGQFSDIIPVHRSIISTYLDDFSKYATEKALLRLQKVFNFVARSVGKKIMYSNISRDEAAREIRFAIELLSKARVISPVFHSHCSGLPLQAEIDEFTYKALFLDIGLMNRICGLDWLAISTLDDRQLINEGAMAEQFIGQHLLYFRGLSDPPELCYWLRQQKSANAEVDYVISQGDLIIPVEVKAGKSGTLKSILQFVYSKNARLGVRFDLNPPSVQKVKHSQRQADSTSVITFDLISLPLYMVGQLDRIINLYRTGSVTVIPQNSI